MEEFCFSTIHDHVKMLNIKLGTNWALKDLVVVTDQATLIVISQSELISLNMLSNLSFSLARVEQHSS